MAAYFLIPDRFDTRIDKSTYVEIAYELNKLGLDLKVLTSFLKKKYTYPEKDFFPLYFKSIQVPLIFRLILNLKVLFYLMKVGKKGDILIVSAEFLCFCVLLKMIKGFRIHLDVRTLPVILSGSVKEKVDSYLSYNLSIKCFGGIVDSCSFITEHMKNEINRLYNYTAKSFCYWSSGVSLDNFKILKNKKEDDYINFFYHGTVTETRGIGLLYDAFKMLLDAGKKNIRLLVVGDGTYLSTLKQRVNEDSVQDKVTITGYIEYNKIFDFLRKADICVCPLPDRVEWNVSSPIKIFEYMAMGKPIVCTDIPAHKNVLSGQEFAIFTKDNAKSIAEGMNIALDSLDKLVKLSEFERKSVEKYTWRKQAECLYSYLKKFA